MSSNYHLEVNPSDAGFHDRVVIQELIKTVAQTHQLDPSGQREFKGRNMIISILWGVGCWKLWLTCDVTQSTEENFWWKEGEWRRSAHSYTIRSFIFFYSIHWCQLYYMLFLFHMHECHFHWWTTLFWCNLWTCFERYLYSGVICLDMVIRPYYLVTDKW